MKDIDNDLRGDDYLWESMFAVAQTKNQALDFEHITPEELLRFYINRQVQKNKSSYLAAVDKDRNRALSIAETIIKKRRVQLGIDKKIRKPKGSAKVKMPVIKSQVFHVSHLPKVYVDAGTRNNGKVGFQETLIAAVTEHEELIFETHIGDKTINEGEIGAITKVLELAQEKGEAIHIFSDSRIAVNWTLKGKTRNAPDRDTLAQKAHQLLIETGSLLTWIPRDENKAGWYIEEKYKL